MSKAKRKKRSGFGSSERLVIIGVGAVMVALALIALSGGLPQATPSPSSTLGLELCNGKPCPSQGSPNAPVTMIEVSDYACAFCREYNLGKAAIIEDKYVKTGKLRYVSHVFALWPETRAAS